jgi:hypothetical protein
MKLNTTLFNAVLEQVIGVGPDEDCACDAKRGAMSDDNKLFVDYLRIQNYLLTLDPKAAVAASFHIGFESGLQYAKVSQEVKQLDKLLKGESPA